VTAWIALAAVVGWLWGSFLNTVVDRTPLARQPAGDELLQPPRSRCPRCSASLAWFDLVPIGSYLALRGRCRSCGAEIGGRTLAIEGLTPALFAVFAWLLAQIEGYPAWSALAGFGFATLSWLIVAVPLLVEGRQPRPAFVALGVGLMASLAITAVVVALDVIAA
jgi:prepilin signal peptidase PulO-like enzyme (type II secretory pathway)